MTFDDKQGDLFLFHSLEGGEISVTGGQPVMDQGYESAVYISLEGGDGSPYFGNEYLTRDQRIESSFAAFRKGRDLTSASILEAEPLVEADLAWMKRQGIADTIGADISILGRNKVQVLVTVGVGQETFTLNPFLLNWQAERDYPAYERV